MTEFEELALELIGNIEKDSLGRYAGYTLALYNLSVDILFDEGFRADEWKEKTAQSFYKIFPYLRKEWEHA